MATVVLTAVGAVLGGPVGAAIGAVAGYAVDQRLLAPKGRQGPRLGDLAVQVSRYGQPIPRLFGRLRVAGSVIWATDLIEQANKQGGGKGRPSVTSYSYSASLAVALSARRIRAVHRIWADGKLLRGSGGDWKSELGDFRLHDGREDQPVDPMIAAAEGPEGTPAYRGIAYAVIEDLQLADFANHIPSLTFEVEADEGDVGIGDIIDELGDGEIGGAGAPLVGGYAAGGDSIRGAVEALGRLAGQSFRDDGTRLVTTPGEPLALDAELLATPRVALTRVASGTVPDEVAVAYHDPARDFQAGLQRARRGGPGRKADTVDFAGALDAGTAKGFAEARLAALWRERERRTIRLPWRRLDLAAGRAVLLDGRQWRITSLRFEEMVLEAALLPVGPPAPPEASASPGRSLGAPDQAHGTSVLHLLDLPPLEAAALPAPRIWIAASGTAAGWRRAALSLSSDGGASFQDIGATAPAATCGTVATPLAPGGTAGWDMANAIEVTLLHDAMTLVGRSDDAVLEGANASMLGDELIQFGIAEHIAPATWRLSRLLRGRRGTEWAVAAHGPDEPFILLEAERLRAIDLPVTAIGARLRLIGQGIGDAAPVEVERTLFGEAVRPPAPTGLRAERAGDGTIRFSWTRRSRTGWGWPDGADAPLGEEIERYRLEIVPATGASRTVDLWAPLFDYEPAMQVMDGTDAETHFAVHVRQAGTIAPSRSATMDFVV